MDFIRQVLFLKKDYYLFLVVLCLCCCLSSSLVVAIGGYCLVAEVSLVAEHGLQSTGSEVVHRLSCSAAPGSGIFLDQGLNLCLLHWQVDSLPLYHQGSPLVLNKSLDPEYGLIKWYLLFLVTSYPNHRGCREGAGI